MVLLNNFSLIEIFFQNDQLLVSKIKFRVGFICLFGLGFGLDFCLFSVLFWKLSDQFINMDYVITFRLIWARNHFFKTSSSAFRDQQLFGVLVKHWNYVFLVETHNKISQEVTSGQGILKNIWYSTASVLWKYPPIKYADSK